MLRTVTSSDSFLPRNISRDNNTVLHLCYDNFDLEEEIPSGSGTTHSTHGIVIQEVLDPDRTSILTETDTAPKSKDMSVKPIEVEIPHCSAKPKVDHKLDIQISTVNYSLRNG